jgi:hypothetical protein
MENLNKISHARMTKYTANRILASDFTRDLWAPPSLSGVIMPGVVEAVVGQTLLGAVKDKGPEADGDF